MKPIKQISIFLVLAFLPLFGNILSQEINISQENQTLKITIPTKATFKIQENFKDYTLKIDEKFQGKEIKTPLKYPFSSILIASNQDKTLLTLKTQESNITINHSQDAQGLHLTFTSPYIFELWRYITLILILILLLLFLLYLKKKQKLKTNTTTFKQTYFDKENKLITIQTDEKTYLIFANNKNCILLDSYTQDKDTKEG